MMLAVVVGLIALTVLAPSSSSPTISSFEGFSTDMVIMNERVTAREPTNEQIFQIIYGTGEGAAKR
jgi:hypothetical protein